MTFKSWGRVKCVVEDGFSNKAFYNEIMSYLLQSYISIETRLTNTFRFIACHVSNRKTFSYEYASILRDAGSVFGSTMDRLVRETSPQLGRIDIGDYRRWLMQLDIPDTGSNNKIAKICSVSVDINFPLETKILLPFRQFEVEDTRLDWWDAYNDVKHSDIDKFQAGNFENALNSVGALAVLLGLSLEKAQGELLINPGIYHPREYREAFAFFKPI